jgi:putative N6-adenine-specific DNA methylase
MTIAVDSFINSSVFTNSHFVSLRTKDAIVDRIRELIGRRPSVSKSNPDLMVSVHLAGNKLTVSVDTSGQSLHRRGYRRNDTGAPLNEVLAAGMILLSGWNGDSDFYDPMCGSGTLGIEAALIARKIPPGVFKNKFGFENSPDFDRDLWERIFDDIQEQDWKGNIISSDISKQAVKLAFENAKSAAVHRNIVYRGIDFKKYPKTDKGGTVILNPPYGERLAKSEIYNFYRAIGNTMKNSFQGSSVWIISSNLEAFKYIGLRPTSRIKLFNGALECRYNNYEMYQGSKKAKFQKENKQPGK